jgi:hypothetical protein
MIIPYLSKYHAHFFSNIYMYKCQLCIIFKDLIWVAQGATCGSTQHAAVDLTAL